MAEHDPYSALSDRQRRVLLRRAVGRPILTAVALTALYFVVPLKDIRDVTTVALLVLVLVVVGVVCVWQVTKVVRADYPAVQAVEALAAVVPAYLIGFSTVYYLVYAASSQNFTEPVSRMGSLYFTLSVFATVGFGDIAASTDLARAIVTVQMVGNLLIIALGGRLLVAAVKRGQARRAH
ncbi:potassium channel family protein [Rhodococcoides kyotonense]|uniref:Ion channel n=1 Tax=Rhodococcoides kyotonense TaxID=398843 RepID=A0A239MNN1_9NOCA|nr:potassium channel family protein [Rhodococcus kyotonensis]SNT44275.1 Ion channel [Rhodococcus kyotonensis]